MEARGGGPTEDEATDEARLEPERIVALGDLHADWDQTQMVLQGLGLVDDDAHWTGGATVMVQTGDVMDRGADSQRLLRFLSTLRTEAQTAGGDVVPLLGNHEVMNLRGDWRYVELSDIAQYGGAPARRRALSPEGEDGKFLRSLSAVVHIAGTVFVHGGVHPDFAGNSLDETNQAIRDAIDQPGPSAVLGDLGPLWYRGYILDPEEIACPRLDEALTMLGAQRMVVGHTTQRDGVMRSRCGGRLYAIDVGIAGVYGRHAGALEITPDAVTALYLDGDGTVRRETLGPKR